MMMVFFVFCFKRPRAAARTATTAGGERQAAQIICKTNGWRMRCARNTPWARRTEGRRRLSSLLCRRRPRPLGGVRGRSALGRRWWHLTTEGCREVWS